ncbi:GNAT family N-acetyltransferase [Arenimonas sp.]|uniref:GNAT family N-acetyltransferase n=1 Tax=Arenimonas sp. TaxID=1872635 RepID=UPI0039E72B8A
MSSTNWIQPISLRGQHVSLEPLAIEHVPGLQAAAADGELWKLWYTSVPSPDQAQAYVETALALREAGLAMPWVVRDGAGDIVGSTRYGNVEAGNRRVEIGWTWYAKRVQRSGLNTEAKLLLLTHAFEALECNAVEFRTNWFNHASRNAIARLGAKQDGVLRSHMRMPDGSYRDTVVFSILANEWPQVKRHLQFKLEQHGS